MHRRFPSQGFTAESLDFMPTRPSPARMPLSKLPAGAQGKVSSLEGVPAVCARLRELGFCERAVVQRLSGNGTLLCQVCGTRVALSENAASLIFVEPCSPAR